MGKWTREGIDMMQDTGGAEVMGYPSVGSFLTAQQRSLLATHIEFAIDKGHLVIAHCEESSLAEVIAIDKGNFEKSVFPIAGSAVTDNEIRKTKHKGGMPGDMCTSGDRSSKSKVASERTNNTGIPPVHRQSPGSG